MFAFQFHSNIHKIVIIRRSWDSLCLYLVLIILSGEENSFLLLIKLQLIKPHLLTQNVFSSPQLLLWKRYRDVSSSNPTQKSVNVKLMVKQFIIRIHRYDELTTWWFSQLIRFFSEKEQPISKLAFNSRFCHIRQRPELSWRLWCYFVISVLRLQINHLE